jgi:hypothetical protein
MVATTTYTSDLAYLLDSEPINNKDSEFNEVMTHLDELQASDEEREALHELVTWLKSTKHTDEWQNMPGDLTFGDQEFSTQDYLHLWDEHEMLYDINAFESDINAQKLIASLGSGQRVSMDVTLTKLGVCYSTGETIFGKVYIPHNQSRFFQPYTDNKPMIRRCILTYNGCETARKAGGRGHTWNCLYVEPV